MSRVTDNTNQLIGWHVQIPPHRCSFLITSDVAEFCGLCYVGLLACDRFCESLFIWQLSKQAESGLSNNVYLMWILI